MIKIHFTVLVICSIIGFTGHYLQFGVARLTPFIPAVTGFLIFILNSFLKNKAGLIRYLPLVFILIFGIVTTTMCIRFLPQEFQPLRKKIIFSLMSVSAWATVITGLRKIWKEMEEWKKNNLHAT